MTDQLSQIEAISILPQHYETVYRGSFKHDSPEQSRTNMAGEMIQVLREGIPNPWILGIGTGPQSMEKQLFAHQGQQVRDLLGKFKLVTLDVAKIGGAILLARNKYGVEHVRADANLLPYPDNRFGLVDSNMAIDFLPRSAYRELTRVLSPGGVALLHFHHPSMLPDDMGIVKNETVRKFWQYLRDNGILFRSASEIRWGLGEAGLVVKKVTLATDGRDKWWEVMAHKE